MELFSNGNLIQQGLEWQYQKNFLEVQKADAKARAVERARIDGLVIRQKMKEEERERRKAEGETVEILPSGEIVITSENLAIQPTPRSVTNMNSPSLEILGRASGENEKIYMMRCFVGQSEKKIFLEACSAGNASYLIRKLASAGVYIKLKAPKAKQFAIRLLCVLMESAEGEKLLPDQEGWMKKPDGRFEYVGKGGLTWEQAKKMCK